MAIFRCTKCDHTREVDNEYIGRSAKCPKCEHVTAIHDTVVYIKDLLKKYTPRDEGSQDSQQKSPKNISFLDVDIHNTNFLTQANNLEPISKWFEKHKIKADFDPNAADTTGFFDEIALKLGDNFEILNCISNQIKYAQFKNYASAKIEIGKKSQKDIKLITAFCQELYDYSFIARYSYQKKEKIIWLTLQTAPKIKGFFNGLWMEWFVLMKLLYLFREKKITPACTRALKIFFNENNTNELDLFVLTEKGFPICIECKSGEFRQDIHKYLSLRKQLKVSKDQFILCVFGLSDAQVKGMTSMYDLTIANESSIVKHLKTIL